MPPAERSEPRSEERRHSSRQRYQAFLRDYALRRLDDETDGAKDGKGPARDAAKDAPKDAPTPKPGARRSLREYVRWLRPHRVTIGVVLLLALVRAGLEMVEPLFMR